MKQNSINNNISLDLEEIENMSKLMLIKYKDEFNERRVNDIVRILYDNGIRTYMFFDNKYDIDEIVYYIANKGKIKNISSKRKYYYSDDNNLNEGRVVEFNNYLNNRSAKKIIRK